MSGVSILIVKPQDLGKDKKLHTPPPGIRLPSIDFTTCFHLLFHFSHDFLVQEIQRINYLQCSINYETTNHRSNKANLIELYSS